MARRTKDIAADQLGFMPHTKQMNAAPEAHHGVQHPGNVMLGLVEDAVAAAAALAAVYSPEAGPQQLQLLGRALPLQHTHRQGPIPQQVDHLQPVLTNNLQDMLVTIVEKEMQLTVNKKVLGS